MKKYAMMIMGNYEPETDTLEIVRGGMLTRFVTVRSMEEAVTTARKLHEEGFGCLELCGAFGEEGARRLIRETGGEMAVGYCVSAPDMDQKIQEFFS